MKPFLDISSGSTHSTASDLSNFTPRPFRFDGIWCESIEGVLQAIKTPDQNLQQDICKLVGGEAKYAGKDLNTWQERQELHWLGCVFPRLSREYMCFLTRMYDTVYVWSESMKRSLKSLGDTQIQHSIGEMDLRKTVLTEFEFLYQLERLRVIALHDSRIR